MSSGIIYRRPDCRGCRGRDLDMVFSMRPSPIGDAYVTLDRVGESQPSYPIDLYMCRACGLAQLLDVIDPEVLYGDYIYVTESSPGLKEHFRSYAEAVGSRCRLNHGDLVIDLGSNDGTLLQAFKALGRRVLGIEPAAHIAAQATARGVTTLARFFNAEFAKEIATDHGRAKLITANNVFANIDDLGSWVDGINEVLSEDGVFVFESFYLADWVNNLVFDFLYHEHLTAFSVKPVQALFHRVGMELTAVERVSTKGGSLRYFIQRLGGPLRKDGSVEKMLAQEESAGLYQKEIFLRFTEEINTLKNDTRRFLEKAKSEGKSIAGFGASITCTTLIHHFELAEYIDYLVDDNPAKQGRFSPGHHLPVLSPSVLDQRKPDYVIVLAWRYVIPIEERYKNYLESGGCYVVPVPKFRCISA